MDKISSSEQLVSVCSACQGEFNADVLVCPVDGTELKPDPLVGSFLLDRYRVLAIIGTGGWGSVYKAWHEGLERMVAIKTLHRHLAFSRDKVKRFEQEARSCSSLKHRNIATIYDFGVLSTGQPFYIMDYLEGHGLNELISEQGSVPIEQAVNIFRQVCEGLAVAHEAGIVHRDIKPGNIFISKDRAGHEVVQILDFGLAKLTGEEDNTGQRLTVTGETIGTPTYMSPEQCRGELLDARSDIYSLGCVMYESLTGVVAIDGQNAFDCMVKHVSTPPLTFTEVAANKDLPPDLESIVFKSLEKDRKHRFQTVGELLKSLESFAAAFKPGEKTSRTVRVLSSAMRTNVQKLKRSGLATTPVVVASCTVLILSGALGWVLMGRPGFDKEKNAVDRYRDLIAVAQHAMNTGDYKTALADFITARKMAATFNNASLLKLCLTNQGLLYHILNRPTEEREADLTLAKLGEIPAKETADAADEKLQPGEKEMLTSMMKQLNEEGSKLDKGQVAALANRINKLCYHSGVSYTEPLLIQTTLTVRKVLGSESLAYVSCLDNLAYSHYMRSDYANSRVLWRKCEAIMKKHPQQTEEDQRNLLCNLSSAEEKMHNLPEAERLVKQALELTLGANTASYNLRVALTERLAKIYEEEGKLQDAYDTVKLDLQLVEKQDSSTVDQGQRVCKEIAYVGKMLNKSAETEAYLLGRLDHWRQESGPRSIPVATIAIALADVYLLDEKYEKAAEYAGMSLSIRQSMLNPRVTVIGDSVEAMISAHVGLKQYKEALPLCWEYLALVERGNWNNNNLMRAYTCLAWTEQKLGRNELAAKHIKRVPFLVEHFKDKSLARIFLNGFFTAPAKQYMTEKDFTIMEEGLLPQIKLAMDQEGPTSATLAIYFGDLGMVYYCSKRYEEAERVLARADTIVQGTPCIELWTTGDMYSCYVAVLKALGRNDEAKAMAEKLKKYPVLIPCQ